MRYLLLFASIFAALSWAGCTRHRPSDDEVLEHLLAINTCNAQMYLKQANATVTQSREIEASPDLTPGPTPSFDNRGLRSCYLIAVEGETVTEAIRRHPAIVALGRSCEKFIDINDDVAMAEYDKCIQDGMPSALKSENAR